MPTLFNKKKPAMSAENAEVECLQALEQKLAEFKQYNESMAAEVRSRFEALCTAYQAESVDILRRKPLGESTDVSVMQKFEAELRRWFNSKLSTLVNDEGLVQTEFFNCTGFALGFTEKYRRIKYHLENNKEHLQETQHTQTAIDQLRESMQKYDLSMQHGLFYCAYQEEIKDTYQPPAVRMSVM
jgi:hypothetical protein